MVVRGRWGHGHPSWSTRVAAEETREALKRATDNDLESLISWCEISSSEVCDICDVTSLCLGAHYRT